MAVEKEVEYHRSFLSPDYMDSVVPLTRSERLRKQAAEVTAIRLRDPDAFEEQRKFLAQLLNVSYKPGHIYTKWDGAAPPGSWVSGNPPDAQVAECLEPNNPPQSVVKSPTTGAVALPIVAFTHKAYVNGKALHPVDMYQKMDQQFEDYATPWELVWSNLCFMARNANPRHPRFGFSPIVDRTWTVIGHIG
jgi:hypothetical protein